MLLSSSARIRGEEISYVKCRVVEGRETLFDVNSPGMRRKVFFLRLSLVWEKISLCSTVLRHIINEHGKEETQRPSLLAISPTPQSQFCYSSTSHHSL